MYWKSQACCSRAWDTTGFIARVVMLTPKLEWWMTFTYTNNVVKDKHASICWHIKYVLRTAQRNIHRFITDTISGMKMCVNAYATLERRKASMHKQLWLSREHSHYITMLRLLYPSNGPEHEFSRAHTGQSMLVCFFLLSDKPHLRSISSMSVIYMNLHS